MSVLNINGGMKMAKLMTTGTVRPEKVAIQNHLIRIIKRDYQLYLLALPAVIYLFIFNYIPMYGVQIAFKDFLAMKGIMGSPWVGFKHFERFFESYQFWNTVKNTLGLSIYQLVSSFPIAILLALLLNQVSHIRYKSLIQTVTYAPHFISVVVLVGMVSMILSPRTGFINHFIQFLGGEPRLFMGEPESYKNIYVWSGIWQNTGWASIIYIAALSSINPELYEACRVDGANRLQQIWNVDIPGIMPTAVIMLILEMGKMMNVGFQKAYLLQNPLTAEAQEIISTYVYKVGLINTQYSYSAAINLFNTIINITLLITANSISKKLTKNSLW